MIPLDTDILVTHGPPFGVSDQSDSSSDHLGCEKLAVVVEKIKPRLHIFGHIHGGHGGEIHSGTRFINAFVVDEEYWPVYEHHIVESG